MDFKKRCSLGRPAGTTLYGVLLSRIDKVLIRFEFSSLDMFTAAQTA